MSRRRDVSEDAKNWWAFQAPKAQDVPQPKNAAWAHGDMDRILLAALEEKKLKPDEFTGGTFCVSNLGMMGIPRFSAIINPPNAAILAVGTTITKPVVKNGAIAIGQTMTLTLSCDHRVVDGAVGAQYLNALKSLLESPALLLI